MTITPKLCQGGCCTNWSAKIRTIVTNISVEPLIMVLSVCDRIKGIAVQNLNLEKACMSNLKYDDEICIAIMRGQNLSLHREQQKHGQALVAEMQIWSNFFLYLFPSIILLFSGAYSDKYKRRKPFIMLPLFGYIAMCIGLVLSSHYLKELPLIYNGIIESVVPGMCGYWIVLYMAIYSYISARTSLEERTFRIGIVSVSSTVSNLFGSAISGIVIRKLGYIHTFSLLLFFYVSCLVYCIFCIPEVDRSDAQISKHRGPFGFLKDFFDFQNIKDTFVFLFRSEPNSDHIDPKKHVKVILIMFCVVFLYGPNGGEFTVMYLYTRFIFHWNEYNYSTFYTIMCFTDFFGSMFSVSFFSKYLKLSDSLVGVISVVSTLTAAVIFAFAGTSFIFCLGAVASLFGNSAFIAMRAIISKLTSAEELGKVMSAFMLFEAIAPMIYNPMYSAVYRATIDFMPSAFLLMSLVLTSPAMFIFLWIHHHDKNLLNRIKHDLV